MNINVKFSELQQDIDLAFAESARNIAADMGEVQIVTEYIGGELYEGNYLVTPKVTEQTMPTKDKVMRDDVTIKSIPFFNVGNTSGGTTAYIGNEV